MAAGSGLSAPHTPLGRLQAADRVGGLDLARGLAVLGMFAAHMYALPRVVWTDPATWTGLADGRSSILFATAAGVSLALMTGGRSPRSGAAMHRARVRIAVRAGAIWTIGVLLIATGVPVFVILPAYAVLFLLSLPLLRLPPRALVAIAVVAAVTTPFLLRWMQTWPVWSTPAGAALSAYTGWHYPFVVWITFIVAGIGVGRLPLQRIRVQLCLLVVGLALAVTGYGAATLVMPAGGADSLLQAVWTDEPHSSGLLEVIGSGGFALAVLGACLLVCRTPLAWVVLPLRATGSMPLTAYVGQLLGWAVVALVELGTTRNLSGFRALDPFPAFAVVTVLACTVWALSVGRGPIEALLDRLVRAVTSGSGGAAR